MKRMQRVFGDIDALRFVDGRLDDDRRAAFLSHLAEAPEQAARVELWTRQNDSLRAAFAGVAAEPVPVWLRLGNVGVDRTARDQKTTPPTFLPAMQEPSRTGKTGLHPTPRPQGPTSRNKRFGTVALGAALLGMLALIGARELRLTVGANVSAEPTSYVADLRRSLIDRAADAYRTYATDAVRPVEFAADQRQQLESWLQRRMSVPVRAPDLRSEGWNFLGGRLVPGDLEPAAFFVYETPNGDRLSLYVGRTVLTRRLPPLLEATSQTASTAWTAGAMGMVLTARKNSDWQAEKFRALQAKVQAALAG